MNMLRDMITGNDQELVRAKLTDIDETINDTAVDVFIYDTSKDSDGGAWRHRTQHTSWYAEASSASRDPNTRSTRAEFPSVAVIVAESNKVTIYDGDDPSLPMWMVFQAGVFGDISNVKAVSALNGIVAVGSTARGIPVANFVSDYGEYQRNSAEQTLVTGGLVNRNTFSFSTGSAATIVNANVNDVAMTVLPDAPTDPATGLPVPTIAVATGGGLSVIKDDGTVVNPFVTDALSFVQEVGNDFSFGSTGTHVLYFSPAPAYASVGNRFWASDYFTGDRPYASATDAFSGWRHLAAANGQVVAGSSAANTNLAFLSEFPADDTQGMVAYTTSDYTTGWMNGDIKLAALADTTAETLSGSELVTNSEFTTDITGWTEGGTASLSWSSGKAVLSLSADYDSMFQTISGLTVGATYSYSATISSVTGGTAYIAIVGKPSLGTGSDAQLQGYFEATATSHDIVVSGYNGLSSVTVDNISVRLADPDRSVNNKGLIVNGSITKTAVATGADVVGYSGFSSSNYLEQPYNGDLDFGTGDFCVMGWVNVASGTSSVQYIVDGRNISLADGFYCALVNGQVQFSTEDSDSNSVASGTTDLRNSTWAFVVALRKDAGVTQQIYVNGQLQTSATVTARDISDATRKTRAGARVDTGTTPLQGSLALWRISATAPTADQIRKIYEDEKVLFQENAKATLTGSSDAVTALAHDPDTNLLHVGTSGGRSVFQGLRRVEEHTGTNSQSLAAISAVDGLVVEGK